MSTFILYRLYSFYRVFAKRRNPDSHTAMETWSFKRFVYFEKCKYVFVMRGIWTATWESLSSAGDGVPAVHADGDRRYVVWQRPCISRCLWTGNFSFSNIDRRLRSRCVLVIKLITKKQQCEINIKAKYCTKFTKMLVNNLLSSDKIVPSNILLHNLQKIISEKNRTNR
jgi:hypothetical protein